MFKPATGELDVLITRNPLHWLGNLLFVCGQGQVGLSNLAQGRLFYIH